MNIVEESLFRQAELNTRRHFLKKCTSGLGAVALSSLFGCGSHSDKSLPYTNTGGQIPPHFLPRAKRVIYLHMAGSPSQLELFDYKPELEKYDGKDCPEEILKGKKFAFIQGVPKMLGPQTTFAQHGESGNWVSANMPHLAKRVDDIAFLKAVHTKEFNHAPAQLVLHTGSPRLGRPSMGSWVMYGLGSENENLPGYVVLVSGGKTPSAGKSVWGSGFLPSIYQGVQCRSKGDPVLYLSDPGGMNRSAREKTIETINKINEEQYKEIGDPEILTRISQYEMAFKMQMSVPEAMDISKEPPEVQKAYATQPGKSAFSNNCLLARRLAERGVRFIQLYHWGWDTHGTNAENDLKLGFRDQCRDIDQPIAALIADLKQRGLFEETLIVWGGEFGRTPMRENRGGVTMPFVGRDHHNEAFTMWMAGGGVKGGVSYGETDEIGYHGVKDRADVHDVQATIMQTLGFNHEKLTYHFQGRDYRLTDLHGKVIYEVLA